MKQILFIVLLPIIGISCQNKSEDVVKQPDRSGSVEVSITTTHLTNPADKDLIEITYTTWVKNQKINTSIIYDTVPSLGTYDAGTGRTDDNDNAITVKAKKEYEIYVTVK